MKKIYFLLLLACLITASKAQQTCSTAITIVPSNTCNYSNYTTASTAFWLKFVASSKNVNISLITNQFGTNATHIHNLQLISGSCLSQTILAQDELPFVNSASQLGIDLNASNLTIGATYYIRMKRQATSTTCDKTTCTAAGSTNPSTFSLCIQNISVLIPLDFGIEPPALYHGYEQNRGQLTDASHNPVPQIKMYTKAGIPAVYIGNNFTSFVWEKIDTIGATVDTTHRVDMTLTGSNPNTRVFKTEQIAGKNNYYFGHIPMGVTGNGTFARTVINDIYPNIDMQYYSNREGVKIYFILHPEANPELLKLKFTGASATGTTVGGGLTINTILGILAFEKAHVYKINPNNNIVPMPASGAFVPVGTDEYKIYLQNFPPDNMPIIIQIDRGHTVQTPSALNPEWSTFFGGNGDDAANEITTDASGNLYGAGTTRSSNFPVIGAQTGTLSGSQDAFSVQFDNNYHRVWASYFGGNSDEQGNGITYDAANNKVYMCGMTTSTNMPTMALITNPSGYNENTTFINKGFIFRADAVTGIAEWITKFGYSDVGTPTKIKADATGNIYVIGNIGFTGIQLTCQTPTNNQYPICNPGGGAYLQSYQASATFPGNANNFLYYDGYIAKFSAQTFMTWSTFFGGNGDDFLNDLTIDDANQKLYIVGNTKSTNTIAPLCAAAPTDGRFPLCNLTGSYFESTINGNNSGSNPDGFISRFSLNGNLEWSTYFGGFNEDYVTDVDIDNSGKVLITGYTNTQIYGPNCQPSGGGFPLCANGYTQAFGGGFDVFVAKFGLNGSILWSTYYGGTGEDGTKEGRPKIATHPVVNYVYIGGSTQSCATWPLQPNPSFYQQNTHQDGALCGTNGAFEGFVAGFDASGNRIYSSYFGGKGAKAGTFPAPTDIISSIATYQSRVYISGYSYSTSQYPFNCPPTVNPYCDLTYATVNSANSTALFAQLTTGVVGVQEYAKNKLAQFKIYPNPSNSMINFEWAGENSNTAEIFIYNSIGQLVNKLLIKETNGLNTQSLNIASFPHGVYIAIIKTDGQTLNAKFIKE